MFQEFNIFDMKKNRMEYEANRFAAEVALPDEKILSYIYQGCDIGAIAKCMNSDKPYGIGGGKLHSERIFFPATG